MAKDNLTPYLSRGPSNSFQHPPSFFCPGQSWSWWSRQAVCSNLTASTGQEPTQGLKSNYFCHINSLAVREEANLPGMCHSTPHPFFLLSLPSCRHLASRGTIQPGHPQVSPCFLDAPEMAGSLPWVLGSLLVFPSALAIPWIVSRSGRSGWRPLCLLHLELRLVSENRVLGELKTFCLLQHGALSSSFLSPVIFLCPLVFTASTAHLQSHPFAITSQSILLDNLNYHLNPLALASIAASWY